jgi:hypothetical protein
MTAHALSAGLRALFELALRLVTYLALLRASLRPQSRAARRLRHRPELPDRLRAQGL